MSGIDYAAAAERLLRGRELRGETLGVLNDAFGEPAWDMLLRLFVDDARGRPTTIGALVASVGRKRDVARTYLGFLSSHLIVDGVDFEEIVRGADDNLIVTLTERGRERMRGYFERDSAAWQG